MENCQPFTRDRVATQDFLQAKSGARQALQTKKNPKPMGVPGSLNFLYNTEAETGLAKLRQADGYVFPSTGQNPNSSSNACQIQCAERRVICKQSPDD